MQGFVSQVLAGAGMSGLFILSCAQASASTLNASMASAKPTVLSELQALYPEQSADLIRARAEEVGTALKMTRSFVPFFYSLLKKNEATVVAFKNAKTARGWCAGDAHLENFGVLLDSEGRPHFTLNDIDDSAECSLAADLLRFLTTLKLYDRRLDAHDMQWEALLSAYREGLVSQDDRHWTFGAYVRELIDNARSAGMVVKRGDLASDGRHLDRSKDSAPVSGERRVQLQEALSQVFSRIGSKVGSKVGPRLLDAIEISRDTGGSAGLTRFRVLVELPGGSAGDNALEVIEFKELSRPGLFPLEASFASADERVETSYELLFPAKRPAEYSFARVGDVSMLTRPRWKGEQHVDVSDLSLLGGQSVSGQNFKQLDELFRDEAFTLGRFHAQGTRTDQLRRFVEDFDRLAARGVWQGSAKTMTKLLEESFEALERELR